MFDLSWLIEPDEPLETYVRSFKLLEIIKSILRYVFLPHLLALGINFFAYRSVVSYFANSFAAIGASPD